MKTVLSLLVVLFCAAASHGQDNSRQPPKQAAEPKPYEGDGKDLPNFIRYDYAHSARDPFLDKSVTVTIMSGSKEQKIIAGAKPIETYFPAIEGLLAGQYKISGIAISGDNRVALVNGKMIRVNDQIPLSIPLPSKADEQTKSASDAPATPAPESLTDGLIRSSTALGLGIEDALAAGQTSLTVRQIDQGGISLSFKGSDKKLRLEYVRNLNPQRETTSQPAVQTKN